VKKLLWKLRNRWHKNILSEMQALKSHVINIANKVTPPPRLVMSLAVICLHLAVCTIPTMHYKMN